MHTQSPRVEVSTTEQYNHIFTDAKMGFIQRRKPQKKTPQLKLTFLATPRFQDEQRPWKADELR